MANAAARRRSCTATCFSKKRCAKLSAPASPAPSPLPASKIAPAAAPRCGRPCATCATAWSIRRWRSPRSARAISASAPASARRSCWRYCKRCKHFCDEQDIKDLADLDRRATEQAPASPFLQQFNEIFYYGFYDLTQIQLDFFRAVASHYPTRLFFPLLTAKPGHDAWSFAARFYERYVQGHAAESAGDSESPHALPANARLFDGDKGRSYAKPDKQWQCKIVNTFGIQDEVATAAKEILRLVDDGKLAFHEIGVVARGLESYGTVIRDCFAQHRIPLAGRLEEPLVLFPLTKAVILLLNLPAKDFLRSQVIDLLSSPYFQLPKLAAEPTNARPDLWDLATRELAICKGVSEWRRLRRFTQRDLLLRQISDDDEARVIQITTAQLLSLADVVDALVADLAGLPNQATWQEYSTRWKALLEKYLGIASMDETGTAAASPSQAILGVLDQLAGLDKIH